MSFFVLLIYFLLLSLVLIKWRWIKRTHIKTPVLLGLFSLKVVLGFALVYLYGHYYNAQSSDIYIYYKDAVYLKQLFFTNSSAFWNVIFEHNLSSPLMHEYLEPLKYWSSGSVDFIIHEKKIVILINLLLSFISFNNIYIHALFFAFIGFVGQVALYKFMRRQSKVNRLLMLFSCFLLPTFVIWSSGILKEPLILFAVGYMLYYLGRWTNKWKAKYVLPLLFFAFLGLLLKPYVIVSLILPVGAFVLFKRQTHLKLQKQTGFVVVSLVGVLLLMWALSYTDYNPMDKLSRKQADFYTVIALSETEVGSQLDMPQLKPKMTSLILNILPAFSRVMFKPHIYDFRSPLYIPDILQNILLLILVLTLAFKYRVPNRQERPLLWLSVLFVIILFTLIGLVTPILGAIVRYKTIALPFLFMFVFSFYKIGSIGLKLEKMIFKGEKNNIPF